jgi:hypothetical protein
MNERVRRRLEKKSRLNWDYVEIYQPSKKNKMWTVSFSSSQHFIFFCYSFVYSFLYSERLSIKQGKSKASFWYTCAAKVINYRISFSYSHHEPSNRAKLMSMMVRAVLKKKMYLILEIWIQQKTSHSSKKQVLLAWIGIFSTLRLFRFIQRLLLHTFFISLTQSLSFSLLRFSSLVSTRLDNNVVVETRHFMEFHNVV